MLSRLEAILRVQSESFNQWRMFKHIIYRLKAIEGVTFYVQDGNIYATKGHSLVYPCVVSHMDTVHNIVEDLTILTIGAKDSIRLTGFNRVTMKQTGIGGDDKVGIYIALECMERFESVKCVFFRDEEVGCMGSGHADMEFFEDCGFVLQCDRQGNRDFITTASGTKLSSKAFQKTMKNLIKKYGYSYGVGYMTDVMQLKDDGLTVSCANIACGYWNPHSSNEYVNVADVDRCMRMVMEIIELHGNTVFTHFPEYRAYSKGYNNTTTLTGGKDWRESKVDTAGSWKARNFSDNDEWDVADPWDTIKKHSTTDDIPEQCDGCMKDDLPVHFCVNQNAYLCTDCMTFFKP